MVRGTLIAMTDVDNLNRYPEGSIFMDCQGSELKDLETLAVNHTAWRHKVAALVLNPFLIDENLIDECRLDECT